MKVKVVEIGIMSHGSGRFTAKPVADRQRLTSATNQYHLDFDVSQMCGRHNVMQLHGLTAMVSHT